MKRVRVATIGAFGHVISVLDELTGSRGVEMTALAREAADEPVASLRAYPVAANAPEYADYRRMLREVRPEAVIIGVRLDRMASIAMEAARAGCHLICEKPLALDHASLLELWNTVRASNVNCVAMLNNPARPALLAVKQAIEEGLIGTVALVQVRKSYRWGPNRPAWFGDRRCYGGTIPWVGIHALDMMETATGLAVVRVAAMHSNLVNRACPGCEDNCVLALELNNGGHAAVTVDYLRPWSAVNSDGDYLRINGARGMIEADLCADSCRIVTHEQGPRPLALAASEGYFRPLLEGLADGSGDWAAQMRKGFRLTAAALWARDAADQGQVIEIPPGPWTKAAVEAK